MGETLSNERAGQGLRDRRKKIEKNLRFDAGQHHHTWPGPPDKMKSSFDVKTEFQSDTSKILDSFNPPCAICNSKLCTSAFNPKFKTCIHQAKTA